MLHRVAWYWYLVIVLGGAGGAGYGLHLLVRHLGDAGLVDYLPAAPTKKSVATAMMTYQALFEPAVEHVIEYQRSGDLTIQTSDEPSLDPVHGASAPTPSD
jgi:hypothetical protein